jgi:hypothetical protein
MPFNGNAPTKIFEARLLLAGKQFYSTLTRQSPDNRAVNIIREERVV